MRMWMRSVWNRVGTQRATTPPELPVAVPGFTLTAQREGRPESLVLLASRLSQRTLAFRTLDPLVVGERLFLRLLLPGMSVELAARVTAAQRTNYRAEMECSPEQLGDMARLLERLAQAA